jgi:hypothetical protein
MASSPDIVEACPVTMHFEVKDAGEGKRSVLMVDGPHDGGVIEVRGLAEVVDFRETVTRCSRATRS